MKFSLALLSFVLTAKAEDPLCASYPPDEVVLFPSPVSCNYYFKCWNGELTEEICDDGLYFSPASNGCVEAEYAECNGGSGAPTSTTFNPPTTTTTTTPTTTTSTTTSTPTTTTPANPTTTTTTYTTTTTTTTPTPTTTTSTTSHEPVDPRCSENEISYWPHPSYCHYYIECYYGDSYEMACPPNKYFSDVYKECVEASESECCSNNTSQCI